MVSIFVSVQLSPEQGSSGIQDLETDTFKLYCSQTVTGMMVHILIVHYLLGGFKKNTSYRGEIHSCM